MTERINPEPEQLPGDPQELLDESVVPEAPEISSHHVYAIASAEISLHGLNLIFQIGAMNATKSWRRLKGVPEEEQGSF